MLFVFFLIILLVPNLNAETIIVDCNGSGDFLAIQEGVDAASSRDTILVYPGEYCENVVIEEKGICLTSLAGADSTAIDGQCIDKQGSVIWSESLSSAAQIINNTIDSNNGHGISTILDYFPLLVKNNIITNNSGTGIVAHVPLLSRNRELVTCSYNCVWNNAMGNYIDVDPGIGAISLEPLFVDIENSDYHLQEDSPCINSGDPRLRDPDLSRSDMGCFWYDEGFRRWKEALR